MAFRRTLCILVAAAAASIASCKKETMDNNYSEALQAPTVISTNNEQKMFIDGNPISVGDTARVPGWEWVDIVNARPNSESRDVCGIQTGGTLEVIGFTNGHKVLVEYTAPGDSAGTLCETGVQCLVQPEEFIQLTSQYNRKIKNISNLRQDLQTILNGKSNRREIYADGTTIRIGDKAKVSQWGWVDVMNLAPIVQIYTNGSKELKFSDNGDFDICDVEKDGVIEVLGFTRDKRVLVKYDAPGSPCGTPCPEDTQYLLLPSNFNNMEKAE